MIDPTSKQKDLQNQPHIFEDPILKDTQIDVKPQRQEKFYRIMDEIDQYDCKLTNVADQMTQAMLSLAHIKFANPYLLSSFSYKPTPALLRFQTQSQKLSEQTSPQFIYSRIEQTQHSSYQQIQQLEQQQQIEQEIQQKIPKCLDQQNSFEQLICDRFNVMNNRREVVDASKKFRKVLQSIMELIETRRGVLEKMETINRSQK